MSLTGIRALATELSLDIGDSTPDEKDTAFADFFPKARAIIPGNMQRQLDGFTTALALKDVLCHISDAAEREKQASKTAPLAVRSRFSPTHAHCTA